MSLTGCFPATIMILLWTLVRIASCLFVVLKRRMKESLNQKNKMVELDEFRNWKLHHGLIINLIRRINHCFEIIILLIMTRTFLTFIYNVYQFVSCMLDYKISPYFYIYKFFLQAALPIYLIYSCSQLKDQVFQFKILNLRSSKRAAQKKFLAF